jgi:hypothetical protein
MHGTGLWIGFGVLYFVLMITLAVMSFRKGHWVLGLVGFIFPVLWLIGAILPNRYPRLARQAGITRAPQAVTLEG